LVGHVGEVAELADRDMVLCCSVVVFLERKGGKSERGLCDLGAFGSTMNPFSLPFASHLVSNEPYGESLCF
jgi:hypothetical protein